LAFRTFIIFFSFLYIVLLIFANIRGCDLFKYILYLILRHGELYIGYYYYYYYYYCLCGDGYKNELGRKIFEQRLVDEHHTRLEHEKLLLVIGETSPETMWRLTNAKRATGWYQNGSRWFSTAIAFNTHMWAYVRKPRWTHRTFLFIYLPTYEYRYIIIIIIIKY